MKTSHVLAALALASLAFGCTEDLDGDAPVYVNTQSIDGAELIQAFDDEGRSLDLGFDTGPGLDRTTVRYIDELGTEHTHVVTGPILEASGLPTMAGELLSAFLATVDTSLIDAATAPRAAEASTDVSDQIEQLREVAGFEPADAF